MVSELYRAALNGQVCGADSVAAITKADAALDRYTKLHAEGAPVMHHFLSRFLMVRHMVFQKGAESLFARPYHVLPGWMKAFKLVQMGLYVTLVPIGLFAAAVLLWNWRRSRSLVAIWLPFLALLLVFVYPVVLKMAEYRFMVHVFPLILLLAICFIVELIERRLLDAGSRRTPVFLA